VPQPSAASAESYDSSHEEVVDDKTHNS
jgi:hypothetical protein